MKTMRLQMTFARVAGAALCAIVLAHVFRAWLDPSITLALLDGLSMCR